VPGGVGKTIIVADIMLPGGDSLWQNGESLPNQPFYVGVLGADWQMTVGIYGGIYGVSNGVSNSTVQAAGGNAQLLGTIELNATIATPPVIVYLPLVMGYATTHSMFP